MANGVELFQQGGGLFEVLDLPGNTLLGEIALELLELLLLERRALQFDFERGKNFKAAVEGEFVGGFWRAVASDFC